MPTENEVLIDVVLGGPHVQAHNEERHQINFLSPIPYLRGVATFVFGDSYTQYFPQAGIPIALLARKHNMVPPLNYGVAGTNVKQFFDMIEAKWVPNTAGLVLIGCCLNNVRDFSDTVLGHTTSAETFRACLAYLSDRYVAKLSDGGNAVFGPGWTTDGDSWTGTTGCYVDIAWDSNILDLFVKFTTGSGGTMHVENAAGTTIKTATTGGFEFLDFTGVVPVPSQGSGPHSVRVFVDSGSVSIRKIGARATTPPKIVWDKPGLTDHPFFPDAEVLNEWPYLIAVCNSFPNVIISDSNIPGWDSVLMLSDDNAHRNDIGNNFSLGVLEDTLREALTGYEQGMNVIDTYTADDEYISPAVNYQSASASAPNAPVLTAVAGNQVKLSWTKPFNNGATIKGYLLQQSPAGAGTWTTVADIGNPTTQSWTIASGLTAGSSYDFRIRAYNNVGNGSFSATQTATAGTAATFYGKDGFNRSDSPLALGTAEVGGNWSQVNGAFGVKNNQAVMMDKTTAGQYVTATLNTGQSQGLIQATLAALDSVAGGLYLNSNSPTAPTLGIALMAYPAGNSYVMFARLSATSWVQIGNYTTPPKVGDIIGLYHAGLNYYAVINGTVQPVYVGSVDYTSTNHGIIGYGTGAAWEDFSHTNVDPRV